MHVDHIGKGIATEMAAALTTAAFTVAGIEYVSRSTTTRPTSRARGVPRHLGYTYVDESPDGITSPGEVGVDCRWRSIVTSGSRKVAGPY